MINFISHLPRDLISGGFSSANAAALAGLEAAFPVTYVGPIDPPVDLGRKAMSKALRVSGLAGDFAAYSPARLERIASEVAAAASPSAALDYFHGFTAWALTQPRRPYVGWSDCAFGDYMSIFHDRARFRAADLARIERCEAAWLRGAARVLFTSDWAARRTTERYGLDPARVRCVGIFGEADAPDRDVYAGAPQFAFVSTNFVAKGGLVVLQAMSRLRVRHPEARLVIAGAAPPSGADLAGAEYLGFLRKEVPAERVRLQQLLATSVAIVHPTTGDISPQVLVEAALYGCPAIASNAFAIPEIVEDGRSGRLIDDPTDPDAIASAMAWVLEHPADVGRLRAGAWEAARSRHGKARFQAEIRRAVSEVLEETGAPA